MVLLSVLITMSLFICSSGAVAYVISNTAALNIWIWTIVIKTQKQKNRYLSICEVYCKPDLTWLYKPQTYKGNLVMLIKYHRISKQVLIPIIEMGTHQYPCNLMPIQRGPTFESPSSNRTDTSCLYVYLYFLLCYFTYRVNSYLHYDPKHITGIKFSKFIFNRK